MIDLNCSPKLTTRQSVRSQSHGVCSGRAGTIVRRKEPTLEDRGRRAMKSDVEEDSRRRYHGTVHLSDNAWLIGLKQLRLRPQMRCEKVVHNPRSCFPISLW